MDKGSFDSSEWVMWANPETTLDRQPAQMDTVSLRISSEAYNILINMRMTNVEDVIREHLLACILRQEIDKELIKQIRESVKSNPYTMGYDVICDTSNNTEEDLAKGQLNVEFVSKNEVFDHEIVLTATYDKADQPTVQQEYPPVLLPVIKSLKPIDRVGKASSHMAELFDNIEGCKLSSAGTFKLDPTIVGVSKG